MRKWCQICGKETEIKEKWAVIVRDNMERRESRVEMEICSECGTEKGIQEETGWDKERLEWIEKSKKRNFEKKVKEKVEREDIIRWARKTDYVDEINEKLRRQKEGR